MKSLLCVLPVLVFVVAVASPVKTNKEQSPTIMLDASELSFSNVLAMATGTHRGQQRFYVFHINNLIIYDGDRNVLSNVTTTGNFYPTDPVVDSSGNVYLINSATDEIGILSPTGRWRGSFSPQERPYSLALLSNGNLVIASPNGGKLLHIYDTSGRKLRSFGEMKRFDILNEAENLFLNRGKVVVDSSDNIYFVFKYAPAPAVLRFSRKGALLSEFPIRGDAIDLQVEPARRYLSSKPSNLVGGFVTVNSAAIDPSTGHVWVCMNGSSRSGIVYEYSRKGKKLREYSFVNAFPSDRPFVLTYVTDILVRAPAISLVVDSAVYSVSSAKPLATGDFVFPQVACSQQQSWSPCSANCIPQTCPNTVNCKAALQAAVGESPYVTGSTCEQLGPGQGSPPKPNGGCRATVTTCDQQTGITTTTSANLDCNPLKYACSGTSCVVNCDGTYTTSNCNNACIGTDNDGDGYYAEVNDCDDSNPDIHPGASISADCGGPQPEGSTDKNCNNIDDWIEACTPILVDVLGNGFSLTDVAGGVNFDLSGDGIKERLAWTASNTDDAWLALDRNSDNRITGGNELFGNFTPQRPSPNPNGFIALAEYDRAEKGGNSDGKIDSRDAIYSTLLLWQDVNHNGISEPNELHGLPALGLGTIEFDYEEAKRRDQYGNWFRYRAKVKDTSGYHRGRWAYDVCLLHG